MHLIFYFLKIYTTLKAGAIRPHTLLAPTLKQYIISNFISLCFDKKNLAFFLLTIERKNLNTFFSHSYNYNPIIINSILQCLKDIKTIHG